MGKAGKRLAKKAAMGFVLLFAAVLFLIRIQYQEYEEKVTAAAQIIRADNQTDTALSVLKGTGTMTMDDAKKILESYGYEDLDANEFGREFLQRSCWIAGGGLVLWLLFLLMLVWEKQKTERERDRKVRKIASILEDVREGRYGPDYYDIFTEEQGGITMLLDEVDSLCSYLEVVTDQAKKEREGVKTLVTDISHQLKTPVAALKSCFEVLTKEDLTSEERQEFESRLSVQLSGLEKLSGILVNISRMETGMIELSLCEGKIFDTILEAVNRIWEKADKKQIEIETDADPEIESLKIPHDRKWLGEALINVLDNAVKYSPKGSHIFLRAEKRLSFLRIEIQDEGIGIQREEYHKVFQRFYRGDRPEVKKEEGSGIGLYLTRKIIDGHNGIISVNTGKGAKTQGSTFVIQLPYR